MGLGWAVWRRRLFSEIRSGAGQRIIHDRILHSSGP
jgi:hypothetical protein